MFNGQPWNSALCVSSLLSGKRFPAVQVWLVYLITSIMYACSIITDYLVYARS